MLPLPLLFFSSSILLYDYYIVGWMDAGDNRKEITPLLLFDFKHEADGVINLTCNLLGYNIPLTIDRYMRDYVHRYEIE